MFSKPLLSFPLSSITLPPIAVTRIVSFGKFFLWNELERTNANTEFPSVSWLKKSAHSPLGTSHVVKPSWAEFPVETLLAPEASFGGSSCSYSFGFFGGSWGTGSGFSGLVGVESSFCKLDSASLRRTVVPSCVWWLVKIVKQLLGLECSWAKYSIYSNLYYLYYHYYLLYLLSLLSM